MNHTGHVAGGIIAGGAVCFIASLTGDVELGWDTLNELKDSHFHRHKILELFLVFF